VVAFVWPFVVLAAIMGWGAAAARWSARWATIKFDGFPELLAIGIALVVALLGFGAAFDSRATIPVILGGGIAMLTWTGITHVRGKGWPSSSTYGRAAIGALLLLIVLTYVITCAIELGWMPYDDPNYLYLAMRLIQRGDLIDPGNLRRIQSAGGLTGLQSLFLVQQPTRFLRTADLWLGGVLLLTSLWRRRDGQWSVLGILTAFVVMAGFPTVPGINFNSSPILLPAALVIVLFRFLVRMRTVDEPERLTFTVSLAAGRVAATLMAFRPYLGLPMLALSGAAAAWPERPWRADCEARPERPWRADCEERAIEEPLERKERAIEEPLERRSRFVLRRVAFQRIAGMAVGILVVLMGWGIASWRAANTILYPIMAGNTDPTFPTLGHQIIPVTAGELARRMLSAVVSPFWLALYLAGLVSLGIAARRSADPTSVHRRARWIYLLPVPVLTLWIASFTMAFWNFGPPSDELLTRYFAPLLLGLALVPIVMVLREPSTNVRRERLNVLALAVAASAFIALTTFDTPGRLANSWGSIRSGRIFDTGANDMFAFASTDYANVRNAIPPGSKVFSAVDYPHLLLDADATVHTLDLVGFASDTPHLPYFVGDDAKLAWLATHHYDYLVTMAPDTSIAMYHATHAQENAKPQRFAAWARPWANYVSDWSGFVEHLQQQFPDRTTAVGNMLVIRLPTTMSAVNEAGSPAAP